MCVRVRMRLFVSLSLSVPQLWTCTPSIDGVWCVSSEKLFLLKAHKQREKQRGRGREVEVERSRSRSRGQEVERERSRERSREVERGRERGREREVDTHTQTHTLDVTLLIALPELSNVPEDHVRAVITHLVRGMDAALFSFPALHAHSALCSNNTHGFSFAWLLSLACRLTRPTRTWSLHPSLSMHWRLC